ncbi:MAG: tRNA preQ1(34) S-adenosylmethionine ribosyltransferase-isomerase QueA [Candidatus Omnitrophota bacterium]
MLKLSDFDYYLPESAIAQFPAKKRDACRLLMLDRRNQSLKHGKFSDLMPILKENDLLVFNNTKVVPARLFGRRHTGGKVELLLLDALKKDRYRALIKPLGRLKTGEEILFKGGYSCRLIDPIEKIVEFKAGQAKRILDRFGVLPLPPYIKREFMSSDRKRYQTVFAKKEGAVAAPTAGLHFTKSSLAKLKTKKVHIGFLTLHVNYATFSPVRVDDITQHKMHQEYFEIPAATVRLIRQAKKQGGRVFAVGTTVCKALEDSASLLFQDGRAGAIKKNSRLFIYPPFSFKVTDALITNFHLPATTLLMLVSAFAGRDFILNAYHEAVQQQYRFFSYGDAMVIL